MDRDRFDELAVTVAGQQSRRSTLRRALGGSLAALLAAAGLGLERDDAVAKSCKKKCNKKKDNKKRRKCRKKCQRQEGEPFNQTGSATLTSQSGEDCIEQGSCTDAVEGTITGTPIANGEFEGEFTGTNFRPGSEPNTLLVDFTGALTATETGTGDELNVEVDLLLTQNTVTGDFEFTGTFEITGGTGRFAGATGSGDVSGNGNRELDGSEGTVEEFTLDGTINFA